MKTLKKVPVQFEFTEGDHYITPFEEMKDNVIYVSMEYGVSIHKCLCGCGEKTVLTINKDGDSDGWSLIDCGNEKYSFTPSIGNFQLPCKSHYIITKNIANFV
jgi:hypothetical protein